MTKVEVARTPLSRMRGLLGRDALPAGQALLMTPCRTIHTLGMRFSIDVRFYDRRGKLVRQTLGVKPGRLWVWGGWRARSVLESGAGDPAFANCNDLKEMGVTP